MTSTSLPPPLPLPESAARGRRARWGRRAGYAVVAVALALLALDRLFPLPLPTVRSDSVLVTARDGTPLRAFAAARGVWRYPTTPEQVSPLYLQALVGYEDRWFWRHPGINPFALLRAGVQWARGGRIVSGGSTLSMQVARILEPQPRTLAGKLRQILRALQLEAHLSKRDILTLYLDRAPFGGTVEGVQAASWAYLGKSANRLSPAEAALLAVLPQSPSRLRPDRHPDAARRARDKVLDRLAAQGIWSAREVRDARIEPVVARRLQSPMLAPLLAERLRAGHTGGEIRSTLDAGLQQALEARVRDYFARLPARTSAALLVVDNRSLEARAYVGSLDFADAERLGQVDMVQATRSPGSTLKPFLYGLAMDDGLIHSESLLLDAPQSFGDYRPANFDPRFNGPVSAADALRLSLNVPAVDLLDRVGPERFAARLAHAGVPLRLPDGAKPNLSIILGGAGVSLEELVGAYAALPRAGVAGQVRYQAGQAPRDRRLLSEGAAWIVRDILENHSSDGIGEESFDTSHRRRVAWKTGTSYGFRDAWALGATADYTVGVWVGRPDGTPMPGQYGAVTALPLLFEVVDSLPALPRIATARAAPASVRRTTICWPLGLPPDPAHPELCRQSREAWTLAGSLPPTLPDRDARVWGGGRLELKVDARSGARLTADCAAAHPTRTVSIARWPSLAYPWLAVADRRAAAIPSLAPDCRRDALAAVEDVRIEGLADRSAIARAPGSAQAPGVRLRALGTQARVRWLVNGRLSGESRGGAGVELRFPEPGEQRITALADSGAWAELSLRVLR